MFAIDVLQVVTFVAALFLLTPCWAGTWPGCSKANAVSLRPIETGFYRVIGVDPAREMNWRQYALSLLIFNLAGFVVLLAILLFQGSLPLNPQSFPNLKFPLAFNTAVSFVTNTNWQAYSGEAVLSYLSQMVGLTVQNFVSAAVGIAAMMALVRGLVRRGGGLGNFWADLVRGTLYILLPLSILLAIVLVSQGVVQNFSAYPTAKTLEGADQVIPLVRLPRRSRSSSSARTAAGFLE